MNRKNKNQIKKLKMKNNLMTTNAIISKYFGTKSFLNCIIDMTRKNKNQKIGEKNE